MTSIGALTLALAHLKNELNSDVVIMESVLDIPTS
jgi:hypothetical protein